MKHIFFILTLAVLAACTKPDDGSQSVSLSAPSGLVLEQVNTSTVKLSWTAPQGSYEGVIVERASEDRTYTELGKVAKGVTGYSDRKLTASGTYWYRLTSYSGSARSESVEASIVFSKVPAPTGLQARISGSNIILTWEDNCNGESEYLIRKAVKGTSTYDEYKTSADSETWTGPAPGKGHWEYSVIARKELDYSAPAKVVYSNISLPAVSIGSLQSSWYIVSAPITLSDDGGEECEVGVCWAEENGTPTIDGSHEPFISKVRAGDICFGNAYGLSYRKTYSFKVYAKNSKGVVYSSVQNGALTAEPSALTPDWTEITTYSLPSSLKLYKTTTTVTGRTVNAWYAIADMSKGDLELRTFQTSSLTTPAAAAKSGAVGSKVQIIVNGGYFGSGASYSYVLNKGSHEANNITALTRLQSYPVTRGAFGVNQSQKPSVKWIYGTKDMAYDRPLPVFNGGPVVSASANYPEKSQKWDVYSAIGGAPVILKDGRICFDYLYTPSISGSVRFKTNYELLQDDIYGASVRPPRTAIGHTADGKIVLMVVDGRGSGGSQGVTLDELARLLKGVGCTDALNLDGGGSTAMCVTPSATLLNKPSDGSQRSVKSFVAITKK